MSLQWPIENTTQSSQKRPCLIWPLLASPISSSIVLLKSRRPQAFALAFPTTWHALPATWHAPHHLESPPCPHLCITVSSLHLSLCAKVIISGRPFLNSASKTGKSLLSISYACFISLQGPQYLTFCYMHSLLISLIHDNLIALQEDTSSLCSQDLGPFQHLVGVQ